MREEVAEGLVRDELFLQASSIDCELHGKGGLGLSRVPVEEGEVLGGDRGKEEIVGGVDVVLDFGHGELAHAEEGGARGDFVAEGTADLGEGEGMWLLLKSRSREKLRKWPRAVSRRR